MAESNIAENRDAPIIALTSVSDSIINVRGLISAFNLLERVYFLFGMI